jgi:hypothetical protein
MFAQYGRGRDDGYYGRDDDYRRREGYRDERNSRYSAAIIDRTVRDLQYAASRNRVDGHDRNHFNRAIDQLQQFNYKSQQGKFDTGKLDKAIEDLDHLSRADRVHPRDRQILGRDMQDLRIFRSNRGGYNSGYRRGRPW